MQLAKIREEQVWGRHQGFSWEEDEEPMVAADFMAPLLGLHGCATFT